jgi:uncharacterized damage-inducible protein DinB
MDLPKSLRMTYSGAEFRYSLAPALVHLFNHQTHHRGQLTTLLTLGVTDAVVFFRTRD